MNPSPIDFGIRQDLLVIVDDGVDLSLLEHHLAYPDHVPPHVWVRHLEKENNSQIKQIK